MKEEAFIRRPVERFKDVEGGGRRAERRGTMPLFANKDICVFFFFWETKEFMAWRERKRDVLVDNAPVRQSGTEICVRTVTNVVR